MSEPARERILASAVRRIALEGIDAVAIARIARDAGVSTSLVHYHFETRDSLLAEALEYSYAHAGTVRLEAELDGATHAERLAGMIDHCLPTTPELRQDWVLWVELWLRAVRHPELRPIAEELYARLHAWFVQEIVAGVRSGEFTRCDPQDVADRTLALLDGFGVRTLIGDSTVPLDRARRAVRAGLALDLGLGEQLATATGRRAVRGQPGAATPSAAKGQAGAATPSAAKGQAGAATPSAAKGQAGAGTPNAAKGQAGAATPNAARAAARPVNTAPSM